MEITHQTIENIILPIQYMKTFLQTNLKIWCISLKWNWFRPSEELQLWPTLWGILGMLMSSEHKTLS